MRPCTGPTCALHPSSSLRHRRRLDHVTDHFPARLHRPSTHPDEKRAPLQNEEGQRRKKPIDDEVNRKSHGREQPVVVIEVTEQMGPAPAATIPHLVAALRRRRLLMATHPSAAGYFRLVSSAGPVVDRSDHVVDSPCVSASLLSHSIPGRSRYAAYLDGS